MVKKNYIIIQAGGKGTRLKHNTWNKPKCLVPILGKPILYHCMDFFKNSNFILIGDYHFETLKSYIKTTRPNANLKIIRTIPYNQFKELFFLKPFQLLFPKIFSYQILVEAKKNFFKEKKL